MARKRNTAPARAAARKAEEKRRATRRSAARKRPDIAAVDALAAGLRPVVARNARRAEELIDDIQKRKARISEDFYRIGLALRELSRPAVYEAAGHDSFKQLLRARRLMASSTAYKLIAVVDTFPERKARTIGFEKAYALGRLVAATPENDLATHLIDNDVAIGNKPLSEASVRDIEHATRRIIEKASGKTADPEATAARKAARALQRTLRAAGAASARVTARRIDGEWHLRTDLLVEDASLWT